MNEPGIKRQRAWAKVKERQGLVSEICRKVWKIWVMEYKFGIIWVIYGLYMGYIWVLYQKCSCTVNLPFNSLRRCWSRNWWVSPGCKGRVTLFVTKPWCNHHPGERFVIFHQVSQTRMEDGALVWINPIQLTVLGFIPTKRREPLREPLSRLDLDIILHCSKMGGSTTINHP